MTGRSLMPVTQTKHNYQPDLNFDLGEYCFLIVGRVRSFAELCLMRFPGFATLGAKINQGRGAPPIATTAKTSQSEKKLKRCGDLTRIVVTGIEVGHPRSVLWGRGRPHRVLFRTVGISGR